MSESHWQVCDVLREMVSRHRQCDGGKMKTKTCQLGRNVSFGCEE